MKRERNFGKAAPARVPVFDYTAGVDPSEEAEAAVRAYANKKGWARLIGPEHLPELLGNLTCAPASRTVGLLLADLFREAEDEDRSVTLEEAAKLQRPRGRRALAPRSIHFRKGVWEAPDYEPQARSLLRRVARAIEKRAEKAESPRIRMAKGKMPEDVAVRVERWVGQLIEQGWAAKTARAEVARWLDIDGERALTAWLRRRKAVTKRHPP